jgi:hypothetical protein
MVPLVIHLDLKIDVVAYGNHRKLVVFIIFLIYKKYIIYIVDFVVVSLAIVFLTATNV